MNDKKEIAAKFVPIFRSLSVVCGNEAINIESNKMSTATYISLQ